METGEQFVIYEDITERKKNEDALTMKNSAIELSINAIAFADLEENLTYVNNSFLKLWGYSDDKQVLGRPAAGFWQMKEKALEVIEALRERGSWIGELVAKKKDGLLFDVQLSASMITDKVGKPIYMMSSFVDITERKKAEEELQESKSHFQTLFNVMDPVAIVDGEGKILEITNRVQEVTGFKREELLGKNFLRINIATAKSKPILMKNLAQRMRGMKMAPYEVEIITKDRKKIAVEVNAAKINYRGKPTVMAVFRDLSGGARKLRGNFNVLLRNCEKPWGRPSRPWH
ncbi:hypothetical protein ES703_83372 [subsurface metagenome]